ncbi:hypothetical protein BD413DRAFT_162631 [Trametes elegans]|nr:hypothetical protein BD413DRAFT_162631 [Trametes elegans]
MNHRLTTILICRFVLDLQAANELYAGVDSEDSLSLAPFSDANGTLWFASRVLGSLGAVPSLSLRSADTSRDCDLGESDPDTVRTMARQRDPVSAFPVAGASAVPPHCEGRDQGKDIFHQHCGHLSMPDAESIINEQYELWSACNHVGRCFVR